MQQTLSENPPVVFPVHVLLSSKQYDIINNAILKNIALVCVTSGIPILSIRVKDPNRKEVEP